MRRPIKPHSPQMSARPAAPAVLHELTRAWAPPPGSRVVVAVSGGADSVALLHLLAWLAPGRGWSLVVASLDHGWRGAAGERDLAAVGTLAAQLELPLVAERRTVEVPRGASPEDAARRVRHAFLREAAVAHDAAAIALAHTLDDQAETVLLRLARGAGLLGLGAMARWRNLLWRPLLGVRRRQLRDVLSRAGVTWHEDETNAARDRERNRVRHDVLPALEAALGDGAIVALARAAEVARLDEALLAALAATEHERLGVDRTSSGAVIDRRALAELPAGLRHRILRAELERLAGAGVRWTAAHLGAIDALVVARTSGTSVDLPAGVVARRRGPALHLTLQGGDDDRR